MEFLAIIGDPGSGKTNMLVRYLYNESRSGTRIASNLRTLKLPQLYMGFSDLVDAAKDDGDPRFHDLYVATDELGLGADSYEFLSARNKGLASFNAQRRKFHIRWVYTVQRFSMITRRLRLLTDGFVSMSDPDKRNMFYSDGRRVKTHREVCSGIFRAEYFDRDMKLIRRRLFNGRKYWSLYDTDERISASQKQVDSNDGEDEDY
jgi:hypothetical protein